MREIGDIVHLYERRRAETFVLATLVTARGSSYRRPGARMLIAPDGEAVGSLSGGCLEAEVVQRANEVARSWVPSRMVFDTRRRFGCHGEIEIFVEPAPAGFLRDLALHFHARKPCWAVTVFEEGMDFMGSRLTMDPEFCPASALVQAIEPSIQLVIVGDGPDTAALRSFSAVLGWRVIGAASAAELGPFDEWTAVLIETHNYGRDFAALRALMPHCPRYLGLVGPRRRRDQLLADLMDTGVQPGPHLFAPAGLDLGADSPEQVALAIVAEIQAVFAAGSRQSLRDRSAPIHAPSRGAALPVVALGV
jgi:xanthine dehydrogenase accessory factor